MQVPLTEIPSVLDLYIFDITSPGGGKLCEGYEILAIREGDVKTITLVDENVVQLSDSRFAYVEYLGCSARLMNNSKILDTISNTPANQVQPTSTRFAPNLESIQNALKYNKKLCHPSISEFEKVCTLMDKFEVEGTVISKRYGVKDAEDSKKQAVLLGVASTIMPILLTKYPDLLAIDSTGRRNTLNFSNTAFMVRSNEPRGRIVATFISDKETTSVIDLMFESVTDALKEWFTKNLNDQWLRDCVFYQFRFVKQSWDQEEFDQQKITLLDAKKLQAATGIAKLAVAETIVSYFRKYWFGDWVEGDSQSLYIQTLKDSYINACEQWRGRKHIEIDDVSKENFESEISDSIDEYNKILYITRRSGKFACPCSFNVIRGHDCQDIVAIYTFDSYNKSDKSAAESAASCSLESYLRQKDANGLNKNELKLPEKRVKIVEIIGESRVIVDIIFENGSQDRRIVQLDDIIGYANEQMKKKSKVKNTFSQSVPLSKDSYGNVVVYTMPYGERKARSAAFALANPNSYTHLLLQVFDHQVDLFGRLSEQFFEEFVHDSLDRNLLVIKSTITDTCDSDHCPRKGLNSTNYYDIVLVAKFKTTNNEKLTNIPVNAFKINKYKSVETGNVKNLYLCMGKVTSTRQIDQWLPLILVINITGINITNEGRYLENKDLPEEIEFPSDVDVKQRYRLTGVSFCDGNHHIADVRFENVKNKGWYQYDGMGKSYRNAMLTSLDISWNTNLDQKDESISCTLQEHHVYLSGSKLGQRMNALYKNTMLTSLNLTWNNKLGSED
ncbi:hypothetical protein C2G38_2180343 [Gigaspora rosea]|uniref:ZSWIM1/3 RNaseH-like domain-containing protein n=1 Tax=Gigaspora rosea TaxID=44941 RepID=A0A397VC32_9GLOM|nr:hypothetical protein C2G38_2180343 [Gigaspora rosea]